VCSIVELAKKLGLQVIAEGVETEEQLLYLVSIGCYEVQGYYFFKPLSAEDFSTSYMNK
jgi:EAL domain-containing protein (putative c-di-GMP-specific phosphodiesterase class I)